VALFFSASVEHTNGSLSTPALLAVECLFSGYVGEFVRSIQATRLPTSYTSHT
jgi:hypothetical protein